MLMCACIKIDLNNLNYWTKNWACVTHFFSSNVKSRGPTALHCNHALNIMAISVRSHEGRCLWGFPVNGCALWTRSELFSFVTCSDKPLQHIQQAQSRTHLFEVAFYYFMLHSHQALLWSLLLVPCFGCGFCTDLGSTPSACPWWG